MESTPNSQAPRTGPDAKLSSDEQRELDQFEQLIAEERYKGRWNRGPTQELRVMMWCCILLVVPLVIAYLSLARSQARVVSTYVAIVAVVVSGWGVYRASRSSESAKPKGIAMMYGLAFLVLFLFYGTMMLSFTYVFDPDTGSVMPRPQLVKP